MSISSSEFNYIRELVHRKAAIVLDVGKEYLVESRLEPVARREGLPSIGDLVNRLKAQAHGPLHGQVIDALTTNETSFFRDISPFDALKNVVIPRLVALRRAERRLTIWCAASSTGQEPYSIAMLLREMGPALEGYGVQIIATDISKSVLVRAREGRYSQLEVGRGLSPAYLSRYFKADDVDWKLNEDVRRMVEFREMNLAECWPLLPAMDIVMLRNVMIYFDTETKKGILAKVGRLLRSDGYLFLGGAESTNYLDDSFERVLVEKATCYQLRTR